MCYIIAVYIDVCYRCVIDVLWMCYRCVMDVLWICYRFVIDVLSYCCLFRCVIDV